MKDLGDIDLNNVDEVDIQIAEREAAIDRLHGEIETLNDAAARVPVLPGKRTDDH
jgi:hypothetical protein